MKVETAQQMLKAVEQALPADVAVFAAAVADWRAERPSDNKIKKQPGKTPTLALTENPDILSTIAHRNSGRPRLVIGFAAETDNVIANAQAKLAKKGCDWILANDVSPVDRHHGRRRQHHPSHHRGRRRILAAAIEGRRRARLDRADRRGAQA